MTTTADRRPSVGDGAVCLVGLGDGLAGGVLVVGVDTGGAVPGGAPAGGEHASTNTKIGSAAPQRAATEPG
jgi:hypothetical protein